MPVASASPQLLLSRGLALLGLGALVVAIGGLELRLLLLAASAVAAVAIALRWPRGVLYLLLLSVPFSSVAEVDVGDFTISATEVLVGLLVLAWLLPSIWRRDLRLAGGPLLVALLWVLAAMLLSAPGAIKPSLAAKEIVKWLEAVTVFLYVAAHVRSREAIQRVLAVLLLAGAAESLYALAEVARGQGPASFAIGSLIRASGSFGQPNPFGGYLATLLPLAVVCCLSLAAPRRRLLAALGVAMLALALLASQSRGAWLGVAAAALLVLLSWSHRSRLLLVPLAYLVAVMATLALLGVLPEAIVGRLGVAAEYLGVFDVRQVLPTPENWAVVERMAHWQAGWYMFLDHPLLGVGPGNYPAAYERYFLPGWVDPLGHAHNYYLNVAAETGVLGLLGILALLAAALGGAAAALRAPSSSRYAFPGRPSAPPPADGRYRRLLAMGLLASLVVFALHNTFDNLLVHGMGVQFGLLLGLVHATRQQG